MEVVTQQQFYREVDELATRNSLVNKLITELGGYNALPPNIKNLIDKELNIERKTIEYMIRKEN